MLSLYIIVLYYVDKPSASNNEDNRPILRQPDINIGYDNNFYIDNYYEYEQGVNTPILRGRLKAALSFWKSIGANTEVLSTIEKGYKIPFIETPSSAVFNNNRSAHSYKDFVSTAILELVDKRIVYECSSVPFVVNPLSVSAQANGKLRLILDLRYINQYLWKNKVKFEDWNQALAYFNKGDFMFTFDLKSGYHHVEIFPEHTRYLGFSWEFDGVVKYFTFQCLPFGLSTAPYIFTKCLKPLVKHWRSKGFFMVIYIDDGWCRASSESDCIRVANIVKKDLVESGFVPNVEKSHWTPTQLVQWLGMNWNAHTGSIHIIQRRIHDLLECVEKFQNSLPWVTPRKVAALTGKIISMMPVMGSITQLKTRFLYQEILQREIWDRAFKIRDSRVVEELFFWKHNLNILNNRVLFNYSLPQLMLYSDASSTGCGAWAVQCGDMLRFSRTWLDDEQCKSSTWRELKGVTLAVQAFLKQLQRKRIQVLTDNKGVVAIIAKGSRVPELHDLSVELFQLCKEHNISLEVKWISRDDNHIADELSREIDVDDWGVSSCFFQFMNNLWGPHTVDRFADNVNTKLKRFNSRYWCPGTEGADAFAANWGGDNNWLVPPICLVGQAIKHVRVCKARATLIIPAWPSAPFWPILFSRQSSFNSIVSEVIRIDDTEGVFVQGRNTNSIFGSNRMKSEILCVRMDGSKSD